MEAHSILVVPSLSLALKVGGVVGHQTEVLPTWDPPHHNQCLFLDEELGT